MTSVLTAIAAPGTRALGAPLCAAITTALADAGASLGAMTWLAEAEARDWCFDDLPPAVAETAAKAATRSIDPEPPIDLFVQARRGRRKKLLVADMESTIIAEEMLDEMAELRGLGSKVRAVTRRAMAGEIDFEAALRDRVALFAGASLAQLDALASAMTLNPGAALLVGTMKAGGARCILASGGFLIFAEKIAARTGFHEVHANRLELAEGRLTGAVLAPILGPLSKREILEEACLKLGIGPAEAAAVGDGANDLEMLQLAGLGVGYRAKEIVRRQARFNVRHGDLTALLFLQGYSHSDFREAT